MSPDPNQKKEIKLYEECYQIYFYRNVLFLHHFVKKEIERINRWIKYRTLFLVALMGMIQVVLESGAYLLRLDTGNFIYTTCSIGTVSAYILLELLHQFIKTRRPRYMTTFLFQCTSTNYFRNPSFEEVVTDLCSLIKRVEPGLDLNYLIQCIIRNCYQPLA